MEMKVKRESGYVSCACRDCPEIAIGIPGDFCWACIKGGCPDYQGQPGMSQECQREREDDEDENEG